MFSQGAAQCYEQERAHTVTLPPCCADGIFTVLNSSELENKYGLMMDSRGSAGTCHSKGGPGVGAERSTDCRLQSLTTFKVIISNKQSVDYIKSNKFR